jgi:hypothetical protein
MSVQSSASQNYGAFKVNELKKTSDNEVQASIDYIAVIESPPYSNRNLQSIRGRFRHRSSDGFCQDTNIQK